MGRCERLRFEHVERRPFQVPIFKLGEKSVGINKSSACDVDQISAGEKS